MPLDTNIFQLGFGNTQCALVVEPVPAPTPLTNLIMVQGAIQVAFLGVDADWLRRLARLADKIADAMDGGQLLSEPEDGDGEGETADAA